MVKSAVLGAVASESRPVATGELKWVKVDNRVEHTQQTGGGRMKCGLRRYERAFSSTDFDFLFLVRVCHCKHLFHVQVLYLIASDILLVRLCVPRTYI